MDSVTAILIAMGVPTAVTAFCFWLIERRIQKRSDLEAKQRDKQLKKIEDQDKAQQAMIVTIIEGLNANYALSEATARAVQRIPDAHCNGDMESALEYAGTIKHKQKDILTLHGIKNIYEE